MDSFSEIAYWLTWPFTRNRLSFIGDGIMGWFYCKLGDPFTVDARFASSEGNNVHLQDGIKDGILVRL